MASGLHREGFPVVAIPKTMDNDVYGTDYCIGFSTAVTRSVQFIHQLRTSAGSHERIAVIELFGRNSGETSLISSYLAGVDRALISEVPFDPEKLARLVMKDKKSQPQQLRHGHGQRRRAPGRAARSSSWRGRRLWPPQAGRHRRDHRRGAQEADRREHHLPAGSYLMRSGAPDALDLMVGTNYAHLAVDLIVSGSSGRMVALRDGAYTHVAMSMVTSGVKRVDVDELYDVANYRPKVRHVLGKPMFLY
jgi:6-phosphofructokinase